MTDNSIRKRQLEFQKLVGFPTNSLSESTRDELSEKYIFKLIEEAIELRKEFPSSINPWSKSQQRADTTRVLEELSDVILFLINFCNVWRFSDEVILEVVRKIQDNNFKKIKQKRMEALNVEILSVPGYLTGIGQGNLSPKYVFVGQNPGTNIKHGYKFWSDETSGSSAYLIPALKELKILEDCYFTNLVKSTTIANSEPDKPTVEFWMNFYTDEYDILKPDSDCKVVAMGNFVANNIEHNYKIMHPSGAIRSMTLEQYTSHVKETLEV